MVCWSVVRRTHAGPHTHTQTQIRTCMLYPVTLALSSIYLFHYTSLCRTIALCEVQGGGLEAERIQGSVNEVANPASEVVIWKSWWLTCTLASVNHCYSLVSRSVFSKNCLWRRHCFLAAYLPVSRKQNTAHLDKVAWAKKIWLQQRLVSHATNEGKTKWLLINERIFVNFKRKSEVELQMFLSKKIIYYTSIPLKYPRSSQNVFGIVSL